MYDLLPFPNPQGDQEDVNNYLAQLKESLEFILTSIDTSNFSADFLNKIEKLEKVVEEQGIESVTTAEVVNNELFTLRVKAIINQGLPALKEELKEYIDETIVEDVLESEEFEEKLNYLLDEKIETLKGELEVYIDETITSDDTLTTIVNSDIFINKVKEIIEEETS